MANLSDILSSEDLQKLLEMKDTLGDKDPMASLATSSLAAGADALPPLALATAAMSSSPGPTDADEAAAMKKGLYSPIPLPNGGLQGQDLADYIKQHPGPKATTGNNPNNPSDDEDSSDDTAQTSASRGPQSSSAQGSSDSSDDSSEDSSDGQPKNFLDSLMDKYGNQDTLSQAIKSRNDQLNKAMMMRANSGLAAALSKGAYKPNNLNAEQLEKTAANPVQDVALRQKMMSDAIDSGLKASDLDNKNELRDPNSAVSSAFRDFASTANPKLANMDNFDSLSAEGVKQLLPGIDMMMKMDYMKLQRDQMNQDKNERDLDKRFSKISDRLTAEVAGNRTVFGRAAGTFQTAEKLERLTQGIDPNNLTDKQIMELSKQLDSMLAQTPSVSGTKALVPTSVMGDVNKMAQYIGGIPRGAQMGAFVQNIMDTVGREKNLAQEQLQRTSRSLLAGNTDLAVKDPTRFKTMLALKGLPENILDPPATTDLTQSTTSSGGKIKVSDGKQTYMIDPSDLPHATADGFKQVK